MALREHALRRQVVGEMHLRRWPALAAPALVVHMLRLVDEADRAAEQAALSGGGAVLAPSDNPRHRQGTIAGLPFVWEAHSEAIGITLFVDLATTGTAVIGPGGDCPALALALAWATDFPGEVLRAARIAVVRDGAERLLPQLELAPDDLVSCWMGDGTAGWARLWADFRIGPDGFGHMLMEAGTMAPGDLARLVQRLQELGNYRNLALLGLPIAQGAWKELGRIEQALCALADEVARPDVTDDQLLDRVSTLSLDLMAISAGGAFRMNATSAYARLAEERLADLDPQPIAGYPSLQDFTQRRLLPAVRTCSAHAARTADLSARADRFAALLRTRIETRIENQNARLLESMEQSASLQLRLQQLVEGLSVVALSYYAIGLLGYVLKAAEAVEPRIEAPLWIGGAVPVTVLALWWGLHRMKRRVLGHH